MWNICVFDVTWNKPPYKPIPLSIYLIYKQTSPSIEEYSNIMMVTLEKSIDLSRLIVTALDNNNNIIELINTSRERKSNSHY